MKYAQSGLSVRERSRLEQAKKIAAISDCRYKHGAVAVKGGRVLGVGVNSSRNMRELYDLLPANARSEHAEEALLRVIGDSAKGATVFVARVSRSGEERMSKPCSNCTILLKEAGVRRVVYTVDSSLDLG